MLKSVQLTSRYNHEIIEQPPRFHVIFVFPTHAERSFLLRRFHVILQVLLLLSQLSSLPSERKAYEAFFLRSSKLFHFHYFSNSISRNISSSESDFLIDCLKFLGSPHKCFELFLKRSRKWKNFKTLPDATFFRQKVTQTLTYF